MKKHTRVSMGVAAAMVLCLSVSAQAVDVFMDDFESGVLGPQWSGAGSIQSTQGLSAFGFGNLHLKNDGTAATILSLAGLDPHTELTLVFDLAMWDSIDLSSDLFQVQVDGSFAINELFGNYFPASGSAGPGVQLTPPTNGDFDNPQFGYNATFRDSARAVSVTVPHTASTAVISFQFPNSQTAPDESFGIDNVVVSDNSDPVIPAPAALPAGLVLLGLMGLRRRRAA